MKIALINKVEIMIGLTMNKMIVIFIRTIQNNASN